MKRARSLLPFALLMVMVSPAGHAAKAPGKSVRDPALRAFITAKRKLAESLDRELGKITPPLVWRFFDAAASGDWKTTTNLFAQIARQAGVYEGSTDNTNIHTIVWQPVNETLGAMESFVMWDDKLLHSFGDEIIRSIPPGSIYFGGTDPGRYIITALSKSHQEGEPFFTVTQNALADATYLAYLRKIYGEKISLPGLEDTQRAFNEYLTGAQKRLEHDRRFENEPRQIKPGEDVKVVDGRVQVSGQVAVMSINALIAKTLFDKNPQREFYVEESFPLDWMYPHLAPHGLIFKLHRQPLAELPDDAMQRDREFWNRQTARLVGNWLTHDTSIQDVCAFAERTYLRKNLSGFTGDRAFLQDEYARKAFSKCRSAGGGLYQWHQAHAADTNEQRRFRAEAELAFKQSLALFPASPETVFRYSNLLVADHRVEDALQIAGTAQLLDSSSKEIVALLKELGRAKALQREAATSADELIWLEEQSRANPTNLQSASKLIALYNQRRDTNVAVTVIERALARPNPDKAGLFWSAQMYGLIGDFQRVELTLQRILKLDPTDANAWFELAAMQVQVGRKAEGHQSLNTAVQLGAMLQAQDASAPDFRLKARKDPRFSSIMKKSILDGVGQD